MIYKAKYILVTIDDLVRDGELLVSGGEVRAVGTALAAAHPDETVRELGACVILPGFVNAHSHIEATLSRNRWDGLNLWDWLDKLAFRKGSAPTSDVILASAMLGAAECAMSGITCLGDCAFSGAAVGAMESVGLRGVVYREVFGQSMGASFAEKFARFLDDVLAMREGASALISIGISPHAVYTSSPDVLKITNETCAELNMPLALHLAETASEAEYTQKGEGHLADWRARLGYEPMVSGMAPVAYINSLGLLRGGVTLAHCVHVSAEDIETISRSGASVAHCPRSNAFLGAGIAPLVKFMAAGACVGIGTDSAGSCLRLDFFEELRFALGLQRATEEDAASITAKDILKLATAGGAAALGLSDVIGTLECGKRADFIAVDLSDALPEEDLYLSILSRSKSDVVLSVVDGCDILSEGKLVRLDPAECRARLKSIMERQAVG